MKIERLDLRRKHRRILESLLKEHLPGIEVWCYGSRVNGRCHEGSDLDIVLRGPRLERIPARQISAFSDAVYESTIPILVDVRDWARLPESFQIDIDRQHVDFFDEVNASR